MLGMREWGEGGLEGTREWGGGREGGLAGMREWGGGRAVQPARKVVLTSESGLRCRFACTALSLGKRGRVSPPF